MTQKIAIAADHGGFEMKEKLKAAFPDVEWLDIGAGEFMKEDDFPDYGFTLAMAVAGGHAPIGIGICGSGIGISMALNRHPYIRAALVNTPELAKLAREHNDANVLVLGGQTTDFDVAKKCVETFLNTEFLALDRYMRRNMKLALIHEDEVGEEDGRCAHDHGHHHHHHDDDHDHTSPGGCCGGGKCHQ